MADRTVAVTLKAQVLDFVRGMDAAGQATLRAKKAMQDTGQATEKLSKEQQKAAVAAKRAAAEAEAAAQKQRQAAHTVGIAFTAVGATAAAGLYLMVKASTEFGSKMAQLQSLSHASADEMKQLGDAAMTAGTAYGFSASQVADAEIELTKAGIGVKEQLGGALTGALTLAAAGQIDVAQATEITTVAMTQFGLKAAEVPHLADLLAAGADKALGSVGDLGAALSQGGLQAHNMGLSIDETVGTLSAFANAGIIGAEAGTQLRSMFIQIQKPSTKAKAVMDEYGISMYNAQGKFIGMTALAGELQTKLGHLTQAQKNSALATIFGSYAINGASVLMGLGAKKMQGWITAVNDSGFASAQAAGKMNSLQGDLQKLSAAFQTDLIKAGSSADGALRGVVQNVTGLVKAFGDLPQPVQGGVVAVTAIVAGVGLLGGALLAVIPKIAATKLALDDLGVSGGRFAKMLGAGGIVLAGVTDIVTSFAAAGQMASATATQITDAGTRIQNNWKGVNQAFGKSGISLDSGGGLKKALDELGDGSNFSSSGAVKQFDALTFGISHLSEVFKGNEGTFDAMGKQLAGLAKLNYSAAAGSFNQLISKFHLTGGEVKYLLRVMPAYRDELVAQLGKAHILATEQNILAAAQRKGAVGAKLVAQAHREAAAAAAKNQAALATLAGKADGATTSVKDLKSALDNLDQGELSARSAARAMAQAIDDATAAAKKNGRELDINTQKGRDNQTALDGIASAAAADAKAYLDAGGSAKGAAAIIANGRSAFIRAAEAMGMSSAAAQKLADKLFAIPKTPHIKVTLSGADSAFNSLLDLEHQVKKLNGSTATVTTRYRTIGNPHLQAQARAAGGSIDGPGAKGVDSVPIIAAPGEHMLTAGEVDRLGGQAGAYRLRAAIRSGAVPRYADGGAVPRYSTSTATPTGQGGGGMFVGDLYLDSGEFLGKVRGEVNSGITRHEHAKRLRVPR